MLFILLKTSWPSFHYLCSIVELHKHLTKHSFLQKALFDEGCIYVGVPPLYKVHVPLVCLVRRRHLFFSRKLNLFSHFLCKFQVERGKQVHYCYDDAELKQLQKTFPANASYNIQRFKGMISHTICYF